MFNNLRNLFTSNDQGNVYLGTEDAYDSQILTPLLSGMSKNKYQTSDIYKVSVAMTCVKVLSNTFSRVPIKILNENDTTNKNLKTDPRYRLLYYSPDGILTGHQFWQALEHNRLLKGNAFARIHRNKSSLMPIKLELLPSKNVLYKVVGGDLFYILVSKNKNNEVIKTTIPAQDMLHFRTDAMDGIWGMNPVEAIRLQLSKTWKRDTTEDSYFENNAFSPAYVKSTIPESQFLKTFNESMEQLKSMHVGPSNAGEWMKMPPFTEIQELQLNTIDEKFINSSKFDAARIAGFYRVPPYMVGVYEYSKFSNLVEEQKNFVASLNDTLFMYKREIEWKLFRQKELDNGLYIYYDTKQLIDLTIETKLNYYSTMKTLGVMTPAQIADAEGLPIPKEKIEIPEEKVEIPEEKVEQPDVKDSSIGE